MTRREPEWDTRERGWMLALNLYEQGLCRKCGHNLDDTTSADHDPDNPHAHKGWVAEEPVTCFACRALAKSEKKWADNESAVPESLIHTAVLVEKTPRQPNRRRRTD